jgi:hypothetical protein
MALSLSARPAVVAAAAGITLAVAAPAVAAMTGAHPTSLNLRATKATVAPKHHDTLNLTLRSGRHGVAGEESNFTLRSRRGTSTSSKWGAWAPVTAVAGKNAGQYVVTVTLPGTLHKGQKEQYEVAFTGDAANHLTRSHSQVVTVTAS